MESEKDEMEVSNIYSQITSINLKGVLHLKLLHFYMAGDLTARALKLGPGNR